MVWLAVDSKTPRACAHTPQRLQGTFCRSLTHRSLDPQEAGHDTPHFCTDPLMATLAHFDTDQAR
jgi:hypothetical protein